MGFWGSFVDGRNLEGQHLPHRSSEIPKPFRHRDQRILRWVVSSTIAKFCGKIPSLPSNKNWTPQQQKTQVEIWWKKWIEPQIPHWLLLIHELSHWLLAMLNHFGDPSSGHTHLETTAAWKRYSCRDILLPGRHLSKNHESVPVKRINATLITPIVPSDCKSIHFSHESWNNTYHLLTSEST